MPKELKMLDVRRGISDPPELIVNFLEGLIQVDLFLNGEPFDQHDVFRVEAGDPGLILAFARADDPERFLRDDDGIQTIERTGKVEIRPRVAQLDEIAKRKDIN